MVKLVRAENNPKLAQLIEHLGGPTEVARYIGVHKGTVSRWMRDDDKDGRSGLPGSMHLLKLAAMAQDVLKVSIDIHAIGCASLAWKRSLQDEIEQELYLNTESDYRRRNIKREPYISPSRRRRLRKDADRTWRLEAEKSAKAVCDVPEDHEE